MDLQRVVAALNKAPYNYGLTAVILRSVIFGPASLACSLVISLPSDTCTFLQQQAASRAVAIAGRRCMDLQSTFQGKHVTDHTACAGRTTTTAPYLQAPNTGLELVEQTASRICRFLAAVKYPISLTP